MKVIGNHSIDFFFENDKRCKNTLTTSVTKKWYPNAPAMTFQAVQIHFHHGKGATKSKKDDGSEHTYNLKHVSLEAHIVHVNKDNKTKNLFFASVVGVMFNVNNSKSFNGSWADKFFTGLWAGAKMDV